MKFWGAYCVCFLLVTSCKNQAYQKISQTFQPTQALNSVYTRQFTWSEGFCGGIVLLNSDSTFTEEFGCEGRSHAIIGKWRLIGDSIELVPLKKGLNNIKFDVSLSKTSRDSIVTFVILDKVKSPVENFAIQPLNRKPDYKYDEYGLLYVDGRHRTDSLGILKVNKFRTDSLYFPQLYAFAGKDFAISAHDLPDTIKIRMSVNRAIFYYDQVGYEEAKPTRYLYVDNKLIFRTGSQ